MNMQRAQFEQWAQRNGYLIEKLQDNHATYEFSSTLNAYHGWQAATEQSQKEIEALQAREKVLVEAISSSLNWANGRQAEWGTRAEKSFEFLEQALANVRGEVK